MKSLLAGSYLIILSVLAAFLVLGQRGLSAEGPGGRGEFQSDRAMEHLRSIDALQRGAGGRGSGTPGNALVREYVRGELAKIGLKVEEQPFSDMLGGSMVNIVGALPGERDESILVCAHHDAEGNGPAAVEGMGGLAVLLELARSSAAAARTWRGEGHPGRLRTLLFASWDGAAFGCAGSTRYIETIPASAKRKLRAVVSLDSVGWKDGTAVLQVMPYRDRLARGSAAPDWLVTRLSNAARSRGVSLPVGDRWLGLVYQVLVRTVDIGDYSDDRPFLAKGVPAVFISNFSLTHSYPYSGTPADTIDQIGAAQLAAVGRSVEAALLDLAATETIPAGEANYLVLRPFSLRTFRLTGDQM